MEGRAPDPFSSVWVTREFGLPKAADAHDGGIGRAVPVADQPVPRLSVRSANRTPVPDARFRRERGAQEHRRRQRTRPPRLELSDGASTVTSRAVHQDSRKGKNNRHSYSADWSAAGLVRERPSGGSKDLQVPGYAEVQERELGVEGVPQSTSAADGGGSRELLALARGRVRIVRQRQHSAVVHPEARRLAIRPSRALGSHSPPGTADRSLANDDACGGGTEGGGTDPTRCLPSAAYLRRP